MGNSQKGQHNKVAKAGAGYVIGNYLLKGITFLSAPIFTRLLTTADFGNYSTYCSFVAIIYIIVGIALHSSINNAKYDYKEELDKYVSSIVLLILISASGWLVLGNIFYPFYKDYFGFERIIANCLVFHCLSDSLLQVFNVYVSLTYSVRSFLKITAFNGISNIIVSIVLILTLFSDRPDLGRIWGTFIPLGIIGVYIVIFFFKKAKPTVNGSYWRYGLRYSLPIVPHGISQVILSSFDRIMIKSMVGADESGIYSFSYTIYTLFHVAFNSLEKVWKPWMYEKMDAKEYDEIGEKGTKYAFGMGLFTVLIMMMAPEIIKVLGDEPYWDSTSCVVPVLLGGYFSFLYTLPSLVEYFHRKTKFIATGSVLAALMNVALNYIFINKYGYIAAAYTTLVTYMAYFTFHYILAIRVQGFVIFETKKLLMIILSLIIISAGAIVLEKLWYIRWGLELLVGIYAFKWADKQFNIVAVIKKKLHPDE